MTDLMLGVDSEMPPLEEGPESDGYDEFNDETFGGGIESDGWQDTHEKFSTGYGNASFEFDDDFSIPSKKTDDSGCYSGERARTHEENLENSISKLVLDDEDDDMFGPSGKSQPIAIGGGVSNMSQLFGPASPPALFDPQDFISPSSKMNIWGSPSMSPAPTAKTSSTEQHLKAMLNIHAKEEEHQQESQKVFTLEELENSLTCRAPPKRSVSPIIGSPPMSKMMPVGTPPQHSLMQRTPAGMVHQQQQLVRQKEQHMYQQLQHYQPVQRPALTPKQSPVAPNQSPVAPQQSPAAPHQSPAAPHQSPAGPHQSPVGPQQRVMAPKQQPPLQQMVQQIYESVGGRVSPSHITELVLSMQGASNHVSPDQIRRIILANQLQASTGSPYPRSMATTPGMSVRPPPKPRMSPSPVSMPMGRGTTMQQQQRMPSGSQQQHQQRLRHQAPPMQQQQQQQQQQRHGSPMLPYFPPSAGMMGGRQPSLQGLRPQGPLTGRNVNNYRLMTPMNPRIPPMRPFTDPGPRRRVPYNNPQQRLYSFDGAPNRFGDPRHQRPYPNRYRDNDRRPGPGGDGTGDDFANLMTVREKEWLQKIQMLQLQSSNPDVDDYYYLAYVQKKELALNESKEGIQAERKGDGKDSNKLIGQVKILDSKSYQPAQFEGALGRVTSSSVNNPRQLIDFHLEAITDEEEACKPTAAKDHGKKRRTLLAIESAYGILLQLDDLDKQVLTLPESDRGTLMEKKQGLVNAMYGNLRPEAVLCDRPADDHFIQVLSVRKGRKLVARVLPLLERQEAHLMVQAILRNMHLLLKKESQEIRRDLQEYKRVNAEETLPLLLTPVWCTIQTTTLSELTCLVKQMTAGASVLSPPRQYGSVISLQIQNKFGVSIVLGLLSQGERIYTKTSMVEVEDGTQNDWVNCVNEFAKDICVVTDTAIPRPLISIPNVLSHFARFVSKQTFNALEKRLGKITSVPAR